MWVKPSDAFGSRTRPRFLSRVYDALATRTRRDRRAGIPMTFGALHDVSLRTLTAGDFDALLALYSHLHQNDAPPDHGRLSELWNRVRQDPAHIYVGAFVDGALRSVANACVVANLTRGGRPFAVIENVVTSPSHRRRGLAKAVLNRLLNICRQHDCYKVMLLSSSSRAEAHALYRALGFDGDAKRAFVRRF